MAKTVFLMKAIQRFPSHTPLVLFFLSLPLSLAGALLQWSALVVFIIIGLTFFRLPV
jgi:hypothetical protein